MFKKSPLLVKEHNRKACKCQSCVKFSHKETDLFRARGAERNLTFIEALIPWEVSPNQNTLGTLSEG